MRGFIDFFRGEVGLVSPETETVEKPRLVTPKTVNGHSEGSVKCEETPPRTGLVKKVKRLLPKGSLRVTRAVDDGAGRRLRVREQNTSGAIVF